jgi:hypothetical protein
MTEHPIIMSAESIRAIQAGLKHETRRPIKPQPEPHGPGCWTFGGYAVVTPETAIQRCPYGQPGNRLWVREQYSLTLRGCAEAPGFVRLLRYGSSIIKGDKREVPAEHYAWFDERERGKYNYMPRPCIFMPRWASRFILPLVEVRAERLWDITKEGALAEGVDTLPWNHGDAVEAYERWWNTIYAKTFPWPSNPWVWVLGWEQVEGRESPRSEDREGVSK